jgi:hypothetical protein
MKTFKIAAAVLLALGFSATAYAQMGKCSGSGMQQGGMMMNGNMEHDRGMMMQHLENVKACVNAATTTTELQSCKMKMQKNAPMMQRGMMQKGGGPNKCSGNR